MLVAVTGHVRELQVDGALAWLSLKLQCLLTCVAESKWGAMSSPGLLTFGGFPTYSSYMAHELLFCVVSSPGSYITMVGL